MMTYITLEERAPAGEVWLPELVAQRVGDVVSSLVVYDRDLGEAKIVSTSVHSGGIIASLVYEVADSTAYRDVIGRGKAGGVEINNA